MTLPAWAQSPEAQTLIAAIIEEQPTTRVTYGSDYRASWERIEQFRGRNAAALRRAYLAHSSVLYDIAAAAHAEGMPWNEASAAFTALLEGEQPDALIQRLLDEGLVEVERISEGRIAA